MARFSSLLSALLVLLTCAPGCTRARAPSPASVSAVEFARLIQQISEEGGYFWSNNYISNETSYLHALQALDRLGLKGGVYVGVGPNQNFTYIAHIRPHMAFIIDIRRQNMLEHLIFKFFTEKARNRLEYLAFLTGRPVRVPLDAETASIKEIVTAVESSAPDREFFADLLHELLTTYRSRTELELTPADFQDLDRIYREFFRLGLDIKYDSWRAFFFPTLKEFLLETDLNGRHRNWLASEEAFRFIQGMQRANLIIPAVGDFSGDRAFRRLGAFLQTRGETVSAFYLSNVEFYLFRQRKWERFVDNVRYLPVDERSIFIRAYANLHRPHPKMVDDHITVTLVQNIRGFLDNVDRGRYHSLWDVVTLDYEP